MRGHLISASIPGTCGELVQGTLDGTPCLVSCPIARYARAEVILTEGEGVNVYPPARTKTRRAVEAATAAWDVSARVTVHLQDDLPLGRGYGSSTADIGAALYALAQATGCVPEPQEIARIAVGIEPTDSTLFPGFVLFGHRDGSLCEPLGKAPPLVVIVLDPGGQVDTLIFNQGDHRAGLKRLARRHREAFDLLRDGLRRSDGEAVGKATTLSAETHQSVLFSPLLEPAKRWAQKVGALGICRAHSGTLLGILLDPIHHAVDDVLAYLRPCVPDGVALAAYPLVNGGVVACTEASSTSP